jgi:hypothetical protein
MKGGKGKRQGESRFTEKGSFSGQVRSSVIGAASPGTVVGCVQGLERGGMRKSDAPRRRTAPGGSHAPGPNFQKGVGRLDGI